MMNKNMLADSALDFVTRGATIVSTGHAGYLSGSAPKWGAGDVLRVKYSETNGNCCRAKCLVMGVSASNTAGPSGAEYAYEVMIVWLPASCSAASTDIGKIYTLCESCLTQD